MNSELDLSYPQLVGRIIDAINTAILVVDEKDTILFANSKAEKMFGVDDGGTLKGQAFEGLFPLEDREILAKNILDITRAQGEFEAEVMLLHANGSTFMGLMSMASWPWNTEKAVVVTVNDITRLKDVERLLKNSERMVYLGRMLDDISHQIRNPVLAIGGFSRRLAKTNLQKPEYVKVIMEESSRLELLLNVLTDFIRLPKPKLQLLSIGELTELLEPKLRQLARDREAKWSVTIPRLSAREKVLVDPNTFYKALEAVVINAAEACELGKVPPSVTLVVRQPEEASVVCAFEIKDNGTGIREPILPRIFNPFFTTKTGHLGMGLTFAQRILEELGGKITIHSRLGDGTTAKLCLSGDRRRRIRTERIGPDLRGLFP